MKRILGLVLAVCVLTIGVGCGGSNQAVETPTKTFEAPKDKGQPMSMERKK